MLLMVVDAVVAEAVEGLGGEREEKGLICRCKPQRKLHKSFDKVLSRSHSFICSAGADVVVVPTTSEFYAK
uniref:Uncharacterized protein n=1 Tax=Tanacetum cinerariifolium TaxID=118510 RepID=A0A6L2KU37_TANCI|nr:hypothetical protein [Tanacetum cinerariifolium]